MNDDFCFLMKFLRERQEISARKLSTDVGLSPAYISKMESGKLLPSIDTFAKIVLELKATGPEVLFLLQTFKGEED